MDTGAVTITDTHAHGLAGHDLRVLAEECQATKESVFSTFQRLPSVSTAKGARRQMRQIDARYSRSAWVSATYQDRRMISASWVIPAATSDTFSVCCAKLTMYVGGDAQMKQWPTLIIDKHAIARSHQRLNATDWRIVQKELRSAALLAAAVEILCKALGFRQFAIPALHGLLVGDVTPDALHAKTYITLPLAKRWDSVLDAWLRFEQRGSFAWTRAMEEAALGHITDDLTLPLAALAEELKSFTFLKQEYVRGKDEVGELWSAARRQAQEDPTSASGVYAQLNP
jgi:hypothetical protein